MLYKFSKSATPCPPENKTSSVYHKLAKGEKLNKEEREHLATILHLGCNEAIKRQRGWVFDFRPFLKRFLVNFEHIGWVCIYSINKTTIRKNETRKNWIIEIHEIPNKFKS